MAVRVEEDIQMLQKVTRGIHFNHWRVTHLAYYQVRPVLVDLDSVVHNAEKASLVPHLAYVFVEVDGN